VITLYQNLHLGWLDGFATELARAGRTGLAELFERRAGEVAAVWRAAGTARFELVVLAVVFDLKSHSSN